MLLFKVNKLGEMAKKKLKKAVGACTDPQPAEYCYFQKRQKLKLAQNLIHEMLHLIFASVNYSKE